MTGQNTFSENVASIAKLDNSIGYNLSLQRSNVVLNVGTIYSAVCTVSLYNRTTNATEVITVNGADVSAGLNAYLASVKSAVELAYPTCVVTHNVTSTVSSIATFNSMMMAIALSGSAYYLRSINITISEADGIKYDIDGELVSPLELTPKMLDLTPEIMLAVENISDNMASIDAILPHTANINTVAGSIANVNTIASIQNLANMTTVANDLNAMDLNGIADVTVVANDLVLGVASKINLVSANKVNIDAVAANETNIDAVAANEANINAVIGSAISTAADVLITNADVVTTNANVVIAAAQAEIATTKAGESSASALSSATSASNSSISAAAALLSEQNSDASELMASKWASELEDVVVTGGKYSAFHWAEKASDIIASGSASLISITPVGGIVSTNVQAALAELDSEVALNTAKVSNVTTDLSYTAGATTGTIVSSDGTDATIPAATISLAGLLTSADKTKLDGIENGANNYVLPASVVLDTESGALHATDALRISGTTLSLFKGDGSSESVTTQDTIYTHPSADGDLHVPATGTTNGGKVLTAGDTAGSLSWVTPAATGVTEVSGTAPVVSSGGNTPVISMAAASSGVDGYMTGTYATKLDGIATGANNYVLPTASQTVTGGVSLFSDVVQALTSPNPVSFTIGRLYAIQTNEYGQLVVDIPWSDTNTFPTTYTWTAGTTAGPTGSITGTSSTISVGAVPSASATASGIVTTGAQTFAGAKTLTSPVLITPSIGVATGTSFNSITALASVAPVAPAVTAAVGASTTVARQDHVHPTNFTATATDIKMNGTQAVGTLTTFPRADHVHPTDTSRQASLVSGTNIKTVNGASILGAGDIAVGGGATGGGSDNVFIENEYTITANYTIPAGKSAVSVGDANGDIHLNAGVEITFADTNSRWVVL